MTTLDYAPRQPWFARRRNRRIALGLTLLILLAILTYFFGPGVYLHGRILYWQRQCMSHATPPETVVAEVAVNPTTGLDRDSRTGCRECDAFCSELAGPFTFGWSGDESVVFSHARRCAAGERLVIVTFWPVQVGTSPNVYDPSTHVFVFKPGTLLNAPVVAGSEISFNSEWCPMLTGGNTLRILAGQCDPADEASFTIPFDRNGIRHTILLRLKEKGDDVELVSITPRF